MIWNIQREINQSVEEGSSSPAFEISMGPVRHQHSRPMGTDGGQRRLRAGYREATTASRAAGVTAGSHPRPPGHLGSSPSFETEAHASCRCFALCPVATQHGARLAAASPRTGPRPVRPLQAPSPVLDLQTCGWSRYARPGVSSLCAEGELLSLHFCGSRLKVAPSLRGRRGHETRRRR